jgi:septal ring factor EnvC (AmiA/AmiB activator)
MFTDCKEEEAMNYKRLLRNGIMITALLSAMCVFSAPTAQARDRDDSCRQRIHKQEEKLERAIRRHGERSRQAERARDKLRDTRARCGEDRGDRDRDYDNH